MTINLLNVYDTSFQITNNLCHIVKGDAGSNSRGAIKHGFAYLNTNKAADVIGRFRVQI